MIIIVIIMNIGVYCLSVDRSDSIERQLDVGAAGGGPVPAQVHAPGRRPRRIDPGPGHALHLLRRPIASGLPQVQFHQLIFLYCITQYQFIILIYQM